LDILKPNVIKMQAREDVNGLIKAFRHKDFTVRRSAAEALGEVGDERAAKQHTLTSFAGV